MARVVPDRPKERPSSCLKGTKRVLFRKGTVFRAGQCLVRVEEVAILDEKKQEKKVKKWKGPGHFYSVKALSSLVQDLKPADCPDPATAPLRDAVASIWPGSLALNPLYKRQGQ